MRKVRYILILISVIFLICPEKWIYSIQKALYPEKIVHVFLDEASYAAFQQMLHLVQLPQKDIKIVWWKRFSRQEERVSRHQENVIYPKTPGNLNVILSVLSQMHPDVKFDFHINYSHIGWNALRALAEIPPNQVRMLYVYEDSAAQLYQKRFSLASEKDMVSRMQTLRNNLKYKRCNEWFPYLNTISQIYPITFYATYLDRLKQKQEYQALFTVPNVVWKPFDLRATTQNLSPKIKEKVFDILELNVEEIQNQLKGRPMGVLLLSSRDDANKKEVKREKLYQIVQSNMKEKGTVWYVKNHPVRGNYKPFKELNLISSAIPFEALILADLPIQYVAGDGTSAFFAADKSEIIAYIPNWNHYYPMLIEFGMLQESRILK